MGLYYKPFLSMKIKIFEFGPLAVNTYVLSDETGECAIIDPACWYPHEKETLFNYIVNNKLTVKHLLNTHLHFDHIFGNDFVVSKFGVKPEAHAADEHLLKKISTHPQMFGIDLSHLSVPPLGKYLKENDVVSFGNQQLHVIHIPGHSAGSIVFYDKAGNCAFVGDVLFNGSIGRTDFIGGDYDLLVKGIKEKLFVLPDETIVYPGHGPATTIGNEKRYNPFVGNRA
jgi:hydroxyacylglutathione hydrolase